MKLNSLYNDQYARIQWVNRARFRSLRARLARYDVHCADDALDLLGGSRGTLLDIGCGKGGMLGKLAHCYNSLVGIDISSVAVEAAGRTLRQYKHITLKVMDIDEGLAFKDDSFDAITCLQCLEHVIDVFGALREINRVLRPGGCLVLAVPNIAYARYRWALIRGVLPITYAGEWVKCGWDGGHLHYFTYATLRRALEVSGFTVMRRSGAGFGARWRRWWPSLLLGDIAVRAEKTSRVTMDEQLNYGFKS